MNRSSPGGTIPSNRKLWILDAAKKLGFDLCGIAPAELDPQNRDRYLQWLDHGYAGEMAYMKRPERQDLRALLPGVRSVICVGFNYNTPYPLSIDSPDSERGWIARYAWGEDYHEVLRERLERFVELLRAEVGEGLEAKIYVDTGPLLERAVAKSAGLGWIAKNTCLINEGIGSWFFLGAILTNIGLDELEPGFPAPDRCGTCTKCLDACPTGAITEPYVLDATRCISYYTIEVKGSIPEPMRPHIGRHVFGCDICQDVCPWNREVPATLIEEFQPRSIDAAGQSPDPLTAFNPPLEILAELSEERFNKVFRGSPVRRPKYRGFLRNAAVAMGNSRSAKFRPILERLAGHSDPLVSEHARWALSQVQE